MTVSLELKYNLNLDLERLTLKDINCAVKEKNSTHVSINVPFDSCKTTHNTTDEEIIYYNSLLAETRKGGQSPLISREFKAEYPFQCTYPRTRILSVVSFSPREKVIYTRAGKTHFYLLDLSLILPWHFRSL